MVVKDTEFNEEPINHAENALKAREHAKHVSSGDRKPRRAFGGGTKKSGGGGKFTWGSILTDGKIRTVWIRVTDQPLSDRNSPFITHV